VARYEEQHVGQLYYTRKRKSKCWKGEIERKQEEEEDKDKDAVEAERERIGFYDDERNL
jgi:hypothetical protein